MIRDLFRAALFVLAFLALCAEVSEHDEQASTTTESQQ